jgi:lysozyme
MRWLIVLYAVLSNIWRRPGPPQPAPLPVPVPWEAPNVVVVQAPAPITQGAPAAPTTASKAKRGGTWLAIAILCVGSFEGLRTSAYRDPVGIPTICFGETRGVKLGDTATTAQCKKLLGDRLIEFDVKFRMCAGDEVIELLSPYTHAAYVSILYNTGPGKKGVKSGLCQLKGGGESTMLKLLKAGRIEESCDEFPKWANPPLPGIKARRLEEQKMCLKGIGIDYDFREEKRAEWAAKAAKDQ